MLHRSARCTKCARKAAVLQHPSWAEKISAAKKIFSDGGYPGPKLASALVGLPVELEIVNRSEPEWWLKGLASPLGHRTYILVASPLDGPL